MATPTLDPAILSGLGDRPSHEAVAQLNGLRQAVTLSADPEQLRAVAEAIPRAIAELPAEVGLAVQQVAMRLVSHRPVVPADIDRLEPRLRVEWLRVAVAVGDTAVLDALDDADLFAVVDQWPLDDVLDPRELIGRLCCAPTPRLRALGLDALETGISTLAMTAAEAFERVAALSDDADPRLRARAIGLMARGWMRALSPASSRRRDALVQTALVDDEPNVVASAIGATVNLGHSDWLRARVLETGGADTGQPQALAALGAVARDDDLDLVLGAALAEPLRLGPPARRFILEAHRHGVFLRAQHLPAVVALFDAHHAWTASQLVRVTHIVRRELVEHLALLPADDRRWVRRARVLALSIAPSAASVLVEQLRATVDPVIGAALVEAAGCSPSYTDEDPLLAWLEQLPEVVVPVLRVKGGPRSREHLRALVEDPFTERELRRLAMRSLWALETDRGVLLRQLSAQLGPHESGLLDQAHRVLRDRRIAAIVADAPWPDVEAHTIEPLKRLEVLCESDDITHLPEVEAGFRERVRSYVGSALAGDFTIKRVAMPQLEQLVFRYGRHLLAQGRCVRRFQSPDPQTGRDLVLRFACDWLHEEPAPPIMVALLETIGRHAPGGTTLRLIEPYWRHSHREVQRAAIEAIVEAGEGARGLELSLCRLIDHPEPRVLVQALGAVQVLEARWAEPAVLTALEHPAMAVKRAAAEALGEIASPRAVPALVEWLAHHDNANFRAALSNALDRAAADARVAVLVDALERETESRRITLLWRALDRHLTLAAAIRLARSDRESHRRLVDACLAREVTLADADRNTFAERLLKARLRTPAPAPDDPGRPLRVGGFSPDAAAALVRDSTPKLRGAVLETIGAALADWIAWLSTNDEAEPAAALSLVLDATKPRHREHIGRLLTLVEARLEMVEAGAAAGFIERCLTAKDGDISDRVRAITVLRTLPPSASLGGPRRYRLLGRLGAVVGRADLERSLDECRLQPDAAHHSTTLLTEVFTIPPPVDDEPTSLTELRADAQRFHQRPAAERHTWLSEVLEARPLGIARLPPTRPPAKPRFVPSSAQDLRTLRENLTDDDPQVRSLAAVRLLDWADAHEHHRAVLHAFLHERITLDAPRHLATLARQLDTWPAEQQAAERALQLVGLCTPHQRRAFVRHWAEAWEAGSTTADAWLRRASETQLASLVDRRLAQGDTRLAQLLRPHGGLTIRTLLQRWGDRYPQALAHLRAPPPTSEAPPESNDAQDPEDPIDGKDVAQLVTLIDTKGVARGLAVRAVHALARHGERGAAPLDRLVTDRRPPVRSAALRALRKVASRELTMAATARVMGMETRSDVIVQLMRSLGHGRHAPALPTLIERLDHRDPRVRQTAHDAVLAWGPEVLPALRRAWKRVRPDRRPALALLVDELEASH